MIDVEAMVDELKSHCGVTSEWTDTDSLLLLNRSYWEILDKFKFREKQLVAAFDTLEGVAEYNVKSFLETELFEAVRKVAVYDAEAEKRKVLDRITLDVYNERLSSNTDLYKIPTNYLRDGEHIYLWPTPDAEYEIVVYYWATLEALAAGDSSDLPANWHEIIIYGAVWRGFLKISDHKRAQNFRAWQVDLINGTSPTEAKEESDSPRAGLNVIGYDGAL